MLHVNLAMTVTLRHVINVACEPRYDCETCEKSIISQFIYSAQICNKILKEALHLHLRTHELTLHLGTQELLND